MDILLVEDDAADTAAILAELGHKVAIVATGDAALEYYRSKQPDLVVTGVFIPGLDGFALAQLILQSAAPSWQPVIFVAAACDESLRRRACEVGADAFFIKPLSRTGLGVRLDTLARLLQMQRDAQKRQTQPARFLASEEEELRIARHLIEHQMAPENPNLLDDPAVQHWRQSCFSLGGDMLAVGRAPSGILHVMLADARGNGLAAYVSLLPIIAPFYRMTEKGFPLVTIVRELNSKLGQALPVNRHVAALLVAVDTREGIVSIWNGGMPAAFMLDGFGRHFREFSLTHAPLGEYADADFDERLEQHAFTRGEQLVMVSDGLLDAVGPRGQRFGMQGLADALIGLPRSQRRAEAIAALHAHLDGNVPTDDMSLVLIDCEREGSSQTVPPHKSSRQRDPGNWRFGLRLGAAELAYLDVVPLLLGVVEQFNTVRELGGELFVILSELYNNALDHGILRLDSDLKLSPDGMEAWLRLREERLGALNSGEIELWVEQVLDAGRACLRIGCRDSGPGFDVRSAMAHVKIPSATGVSSLPFGRGLTLLQHIAREIDFNEAGNEVMVMLSLDSGQRYSDKQHPRSGKGDGAPPHRGLYG